MVPVSPRWIFDDLATTEPSSTRAQRDCRVWEDYRVACKNTFLDISSRKKDDGGAIPKRRCRSQPPVPVSVRPTEQGVFVVRRTNDEPSYLASLENIGSLVHKPGGNCRGRACFFAHTKKGCNRGWMCVACHYCEPLPPVPSTETVQGHMRGFKNFLKRLKKKRGSLPLAKNERERTSLTQESGEMPPSRGAFSRSSSGCSSSLNRSEYEGGRRPFKSVSVSASSDHSGGGGSPPHIAAVGVGARHSITEPGPSRSGEETSVSGASSRPRQQRKRKNGIRKGKSLTAEILACPFGKSADRCPKRSSTAETIETLNGEKEKEKESQWISKNTASPGGEARVLITSHRLSTSPLTRLIR